MLLELEDEELEQEEEHDEEQQELDDAVNEKSYTTE